MKIIIHIGAEKTGTTTVQEFCARNRAALASRGILYPVSLGSPNHIKLTAYSLADRKIDDIRRDLGLVDAGQIPAFRARVERDLGEEIETFGAARVLLVSNEHLQSRLLRLDEVQRLRSLFGRWSKDFTIVVYLRRQDRLAVSHYSTKLKAGSLEGDDVFPVVAEGGELPRYYDYDTMLKLYEEVFGIDNIVVRIFEPHRLMKNDLLTDFRAVCGVSEGDDLVEAPRRNESLSAAGIEFFRRFNQVVPRFVDGKPNPRRNEVIGAVMKAFHGAGPDVRRVDAKTFYDHFRQGNEAIGERYFPGGARDLFETNFADYAPGRGQPADREALVDLAIHLWLDRWMKLEEARITAYLLSLELAAKSTNGSGALPLVPEFPPDLALPVPLALKLVGALIRTGDGARAAALARTIQQQHAGARPVLSVARGYCLKRAKDNDGWLDLMEEYAPYRRITASLSSLSGMALEDLGVEEGLARLRDGDPNQADFYDRCVAWLENGAGRTGERRPRNAPGNPARNRHPEAPGAV